MPAPPLAVLDTSVLLGGRDPPPGWAWATTPEAQAEVSPGGRDARRFDNWFAKGLQVRSAGHETRDRIEETAIAAGNLGRLSDADISLLALALENKGTLWTDDHTMLDVALRLGIATQTVNSAGINGTKEFRPRCLGCGRWYETMPKANECIVCGTEVKLKPWQPKTPG